MEYFNGDQKGFELDTCSDRLPVKLLKELRNMTVFRCAEDQSRTGVHHTLKFLHMMARNSIGETIAVV